MACNATRIELSNSAVTTLTVTLTTDPGDGATVLLIVDGLGITTSGTTSGGSATLTPVAAVVADTNSIWDAIIQVGTNRPAVAEVLVTETNTAQSLGITITDSQVTYCAPSGGGGGGDALTAGDVDQFADVTYPATIREGDYLSRSLAGSWTSNRPESFPVDRRPMMVAVYGVNSADSAGWGVAQNLRLTPLTGDTVNHADEVNNGRLRFFKDKMATPQAANTEKIQRYVVNSPAGWIKGQETDSFPSTAGYTIENDPASLDDYQADGTVVQSFPTPFTTDGTTSGTIGNQKEAWTAAVDWFRTEIGGTIELTAYIGYYVTFEPNASGQPTATFLTDIGGYKAQWAFAVKPTPDDVEPFFGPQWDTFLDIGFDTMGFDLGTNVYTDSGVAGRALIDAFVDTVNSRFCVEAVPRDLTAGDNQGGQLHDSRAYQNARFWLYFPSLVEIDGTTTGGSNRLVVDKWNLDPSNTEVHVVFDWFQCASSTTLNLTGARIRELMNIAHERGFVVSTTGGTSPVETSDGWTVAEYHQYAIDLWKKSRGLIADAAVSSVNGATGVVVLNGEDIDTTASSGTTIKSAIDTLNLIAVGNATAIAQLDLDALTDVNAPTPSNGEVLQFDQATGKWVSAGVGGTGTVTSVGLNVPGGFTVVGTNPITSSGTFEITSSLSGVIKADGAATFSGSAELNDLADVNVSQGAGNDGDLVFYDHAAGAGAKFKGVARSSIALSEFNNDLPAVQDSYLMLIESPSVKAYTLDGSVTADRTITAIYAKLGGGTSATVDFKRTRSGTTVDIASSVAVTTTAATPPLSNTGLQDGDRLWINVSAISAPEDMEIVVEYTQ